MNNGENLLNSICSLETADRGLLRGLDPHHLHKIAALSLEARFDRGHVVFHQGDLTGFFYLIVSGSVELDLATAKGEKHVQTLHAGDAFGWSSVLDGERKHYQARALSDVVALALDGYELRKACDQDPEFGYALMKRLLALVARRLDETGKVQEPAVVSPIWVDKPSAFAAGTRENTHVKTLP